MSTISPEYLLEQELLHQNPQYGVASTVFAPMVASIVRDSRIGSITDYGAGKKRLIEELNRRGTSGIVYHPYDPAFPEYGEAIPGSDLVTCIDVLEHIEPELLENVLLDLKRLHGRLYFITIHVGPAGKTLSDGRNAHLIQKPASWWLPRLCTHFEVAHVQMHALMGKGFWCLLYPKTGTDGVNRSIDN